jgi:hypothetical protein
MDFNSIKDAVSNISLYDVKAGVRKIQNGRLLCSLSATTSSQPLTKARQRS